MESHSMNLNKDVFKKDPELYRKSSERLKEIDKELPKAHAAVASESGKPSWKS